MDRGIELEQTTEHLNETSSAENLSVNTGRPILDVTSGISTLQAVLTEVQATVQHFTELEDILSQLSKSRSLKRDRTAQMSHITEIIEHINAMDQQHTAEGYSVFGETEDAPVVSLPDGSGVSLRPSCIHPLLNAPECQSQRDVAAYLETLKAQLQDIQGWQNYLLGQLDALVEKLPYRGAGREKTAQQVPPSEAGALAQEMTSSLADQLLASDVLSLTHMGQLKGDRVAALLDDPTVPHPTPSHLAVKSQSLNVH